MAYQCSLCEMLSRKNWALKLASLPSDRGIAPGNVEIGGAALLALSR